MYLFSGKMSGEVWKVYIPHQVFLDDHADLFGHYNNQDHSIYVTSAAKSSLHVERQGSLQPHVVGCWSKHGTHTVGPVKKSPVYVSVEFNLNANIVCRCYRLGEEVFCTCVVYNPSDILQSKVLSQRILYTASGDFDKVTCLVKELTNRNTKESHYSLDHGATFYSERKDKIKISKIVTVLHTLLWFLYLPFAKFPLLSQRSVEIH